MMSILFVVTDLIQDFNDNIYHTHISKTYVSHFNWWRQRYFSH